MVKSKKMSKTSIAVIVLALLLVLSMVLGLTGAWFTASKSDNMTGGSATFTIGDFLQLNIVKETNDAAAALYRKSVKNDGTLNEYAAIEGLVAMPGDQIRVAGDAKITITAAKEGTVEKEFWYTYRTSSDGAWAEVDHANTGNSDWKLEVALSAANAAASGQLVTNELVTKNGAVFQISENVNNGHKGQQIVVTFDNIHLEVRTMQYENVSKTAATSYLTGNGYQDPANPSQG